MKCDECHIRSWSVLADLGSVRRASCWLTFRQQPSRDTCGTETKRRYVSTNVHIPKILQLTQFASRPRPPISPIWVATMSETSPTLVVCTCISFKCRLASFVNQYGVFQPGKEIRSQLRSKHRARDYELAVSAEVRCWFKCGRNADFCFY